MTNSDTIHCPICGATWSVGDESPACTCTHTAAEKPPYFNWIFGSENPQ